MAKSLLDELREYLEGVKNPFLFLMVNFLALAAISAVVLVGVYFYTRY